MSNTLGDYGTPPDPLNVRLPDPRDDRIAELEAALREIAEMNEGEPIAAYSWGQELFKRAHNIARAALSTKEDTHG